VTEAISIRKYKLTEAERPHREVYVGDLPLGVSLDVVKASFDDLMKELPQYKDRYAHLQTPVIAVRSPPQGPRCGFLFVEFADPVLASTAVSMSGLRISGRSARVNRPSRGPSPDQAAIGLDVQPLRASGRIPWVGGPGARMQCEIWVGGSPVRALSRSGALSAELSRALLALPSVRTHFPELEDAVTSVKMGEGGSFVFAELANERLASTAVTLGRLELTGGGHVKTGWPTNCVDAGALAPPSLEEPREPPLPQLTEGAEQGIASLDHFAEESNSEVYIGGVRGLEAIEIWSALVELFQSLPSYRVRYEEGSAEPAEPVINLRTGKGSFAFARLADPVLASTAVALGSMRVRGRRIPLCRPSHFEPPAAGPPAPLEIGPHVALQDLAPSTPPPERPAPPTPPSPPVRVALLWVGNLPIDGTSAESKRDRLEKYLTRVALASPGYDLDAGPPVRNVRMHESGKYAFVELHDTKLAERLIRVYHGCDFGGRPLAVNWARRRPWRPDAVDSPRDEGAEGCGGVSSLLALVEQPSTTTTTLPVPTKGARKDDRWGEDTRSCRDQLAPVSAELPPMAAPAPEGSCEDCAEGGPSWTPVPAVQPVAMTTLPEVDVKISMADF